MAMAVTSGAALASSDADSDAKSKGTYEVTITNITDNIVFTPILVASHRKGVKLFALGQPASSELGRVAEGGDIAPMTAALMSNNRVVDVANSGGPLLPGASVTVSVDASGARFISVASMMLPTNDGFIALNGVKAPKKHRKSTTYLSPGYDAGTETDDELCANIPGPQCGGEPFSPNDQGEGYVHIHSGIHGIGDLGADVYDWRNPAAAISIKRVRNGQR
jgi:2',3'-cyclic-nucleotide 2'-phosphodiesterase (5'-nucleotidase family)